MVFFLRENTILPENTQDLRRCKKIGSGGMLDIGPHIWGLSDTPYV